MIDSAKLVDLLARGIPNIQIAKALGITEGRVTQLVDEPKVKKLVNDRQSELAIEDVAAITDIEQINRSLLSKMSELVDGSESLNEVVNAYEKMTRMENSKKGLSTESEDGIRSITLQVPIFVQQNLNLQVNQRGEIIDIDDRAMTTMPTIAVHTMIKERAKDKSNTDIDPAQVAL